MFDGEPPRADAGAGVRRYWLMTTEPPGFSGGIGVYTGQTARMLALQGVAVTVLQHDPAVGDPVCGWDDGYRTIRCGGRGLDRRPIPSGALQGPLRAARELGELACALIALEGAPDVVEAQDYGALAQHLLKRRLMEPERAWPKVVLTAHRPHLHCVITDGDSPHEHRTAFLGEAERWCYAAADAVFAPARFILQPLRRLGFPLDRAAVVRNPYDPAALEATPPAPHLAAEAEELAARLHSPAEPLLFVGKLQAQKGASDLLATLDALHTEGDAPPCWMFGRDAMLSGTASTTYDVARRRHPRLFAEGRLRYFGGYGLADLRALGGGHPIAALPYREDCLPYAYIEAVLCGAIPLTSGAGGQAELIPADLVELCTADVAHPDAWVAKLDRLRALDPQARREVSGRLCAAVRAETDPQAVWTAKAAALGKVAPTWRARDYPFVHTPAERRPPPDPSRRRELARAVPQRGATRHVSTAGPPPGAPDDLVSVVVPYFEMQAFVDEALASIEAQDHPDVEVVIVDDGSPSPEARDRLQALLAAPRRFPTRVLRKTNGGLADARNAGAKASRGDYLYFLDADDRIHPSTLSRSLKVLKRFANVGYVGAALKEFGESEGEWAVHDVDGPYIGFHNLQICAFLVRAEAWLAHGVNDPTMSLGMEDYESHVRMFAAGVRGVALPETLFHYRKRPGSMSRAFDPHGVAYLYRRIWQANPELFRRFGPELVGLYAENGHGALAPSVGVESEAHRRLFVRDIPDLGELADHLEAHASHAGLGRALRARCAVGGAEWDYTTARLLMALDLEPDFVRQLLRAAVDAAPQNGWFRLYAVIAELRAERPALAQAYWRGDLERFCRAEVGAIAWILALEELRGYPGVRPSIAGRLGDAGAALPALERGPLAEAAQALLELAAKDDDDGAAHARAVLVQAGLAPEAAEAIVRKRRRDRPGRSGAPPLARPVPSAGRPPQAPRPALRTRAAALIGALR